MPPGQSQYEDPDSGVPISLEALAAERPDAQKRIMRAWFYLNYEDPAERTPYETREGGYQWIWGGPYEAREELEAEFGDVVPHDVIAELASELDDECWQWGPAEKPSDYDEYLYDVIAHEPEISTRYFGAINRVNELLYLDIPPEAEATLFKLLFVNVISALETYLSDAFISTLEANPQNIGRYVKAHPVLRDRKVPLSAIFDPREKLEEEIRSSLVEMAWHNLAKVALIFDKTFGVEFPADIRDLYRAILIRHDIVHRNGKSKDGVEIAITREEVRLLIEACGAFVRALEVQLPQPTTASAIKYDDLGVES